MFGLPDSSISEAVKAQLDTQISLFTQFSNQLLDSMQRMNKMSTQAAKTMLEQSLAGTKEYCGTRDESRSDQEQAPGTQAGIAKIVDTYVPAHAPEEIVKEVVQKASEATAKAIAPPKSGSGKAAVPTNQTAERSGQSDIAKPH